MKAFKIDIKLPSKVFLVVCILILIVDKPITGIVVFSCVFAIGYLQDKFLEWIIPRVSHFPKKMKIKVTKSSDVHYFVMSQYQNK